MSFLFTTDKQKEMMLKKRHMHSILLYNLQQSQNKRRRKEGDIHQFEESSYRVNKDAVQLLLEETRRKERRKLQERDLLRESYEKQIQDKQERFKYEKREDRQHFQKQMQQSEYLQAVRMRELFKSINRASFHAIPAPTHNRSKTLPSQLPSLQNQIPHFPRISTALQKDLTINPSQFQLIESHQNLPNRVQQNLQKSNFHNIISEKKVKPVFDSFQIDRSHRIGGKVSTGYQ